MNPAQVKTWEFVERYLASKGFVQTSETVDGGRIWRSRSRKHMIVTDHVDGFYPEFLWNDLVRRVAEIVP